MPSSLSIEKTNKSKIKQYLFEYRYAFCFLAIGIVYFFNMFIDVMDIDAAQYFSISREMLETGNYLEIHTNGADYLDKPPLLFWLASLSFKLFGMSNFSYKLPAILMLILAVYATYQFAKEWYNKQTAFVAALILCSTQGFFLMSNDVRTDGILTSLIICTVWQLSVFIKQASIKNLIWGSIALAAAMLTKGPIAIIIVGCAIGGQLLLQRKWKLIFNWKWIITLLIIAVILLPMCYGLYRQFDLHPEKEVYGLHGPSGIKFFFWTQSFGRITGNIYWDNGAGFFFLFHTILWDFAPWILFLIPALIFSLVRLVKSKLKADENTEYITLCGFVLNFLAISLSSYKLPHYVFPLFPFAAVFTANFFVWLSENRKNIFTRFSNVFFGLLNLFFIAPFICFFFMFPPPTILLPIVIIALYILFWYLFLNPSSILDRILLPGMLACFVLGLVMATYFYPNLLQYQAEGQAGKEATKRKLSLDMFYWHNAYTQSLDAYAQRNVPRANINSLSSYKPGTIIFTDSIGMQEILNAQKQKYRIIKQYERFYVSALDIKFLLEKTRPSTLQKRYLLQKD